MGGEIIYLSLHCHHQNDSCIKMGSDESHFNVSLIMRDKVKRQRPETTIFEEKGQPILIRTEVPLLTVVVCSLTSIQEARGKRSNHLLVSLSAIAQDKTKAIKTQFRNCT